MTSPIAGPAERRTDPEHLLALYARGLDAFGDRVRSVPADRWSSPTPCREWTVRDLVGHVLGEQAWAPALLAGETVEQVGDRFAGDLLGDDPAGAWQRARDAAWAAFDADGALGRTVHLSYGDAGAEHYLREMTADLVVHAWDLSRGAGLPEADGLDGELVALADAMAPQRPVDGLFDPPVDPGRDADPVRRLVARFGRDPRS